MNAGGPDDAQKWASIWEVFHDALEKHPAERTGFLARRCGTDSDLILRVRQLIRAHESDDTFMTEPPSLLAGFDHESTDQEPQPGSFIGLYQITRRIGHGGMGDVYLAEQQRPVRRQVAIKILQLGMSTRDVLARFEAERQALALMSHSNIAKVYDAGTTDTGRPYFVMEYVEGEPVTQYCDRRRLSLEDRVQVFLRICEGVQHAHQKGIIHRDLKPSNVLVTEENGVPVPKIIDFGIAKATDQHLTEETLHTRIGAIVGTPTYMSPEQAGLANVDIDIRTDVYSLSVLLYELLVGVVPFESTSLKARGYAEIQRMIRDEEPVRPSAHLASLSEEDLSSLAASRRTSLRRLAKDLDSDLSWIALKGMEKERERRYSTVIELAVELQRHLRGLPVEARAPTRGYRAKKFVLRHKLGVGISAAVAGLVVAFAIAMTVQTLRLNQALQETTVERNRAERVSTFLVELFDAANPNQNQGESVTVRGMLDEGAQRLESELLDQPDLRATLMATMGRAYRVLGVYDRAEEITAQALADQRATGDVVGIVETLNSLGEIAHDKGDLEHAESLYRQAADASEADPAASAVQHSVVLNNLATLLVDRGDPVAAQPLAEQALALRRERFGPRSKEVADILETLSSVTSLNGDSRAALEMSAEATDIIRELYGDRHPSFASSLNYYANGLRRAGRNAEAKAALQQAVDIYRTTHGDDHLYLASSLNNLALTFNIDGDHEQAEAALIEAVDIVERTFGSKHPRVNTMRLNLGATRNNLGRYEDAARLLQQSVEGDREAFGEALILAPALDQWGLALRNLGKFADAVKLHEESLELRYRFTGRENPDAAISLHNIAINQMSLGESEQALQLLEQALQLHRDGLGESHPNIAATLAAKATVLTSLDRFSEAKRYFNEALTMQRNTLGEENPSVTNTLQGLAALAERRGDLELAAAGFQQVIDRRAGNANPAAAAWSQGALGSVLCRTGQLDAGERYIANGLAAVTGRLPADNWQLALFRSYYAECEMGRGNSDTARQYLQGARAVIVDKLGTASLPARRIDERVADLNL